MTLAESIRNALNQGCDDDGDPFSQAATSIVAVLEHALDDGINNQMTDDEYQILIKLGFFVTELTDLPIDPRPA
jgi:hypothetical protein